MGQGTLTIYNASAGSGKTFSLAKAYLNHLFRSRYNYRKILAVTFTNKATAEMKSRILDQLYVLSEGGKSDYLADIIKETGKSEEMIRKEAGEILYSILHDFSRFSISTIDAFFQKVLRAFTREAGLHSGFNIELDHSLILSAAVEEMIASSVTDPKIRNWLTQYVLANLGEEKTWDIKGDIMKLAEELFRERFRILSDVERTNLENKDFLLNYIRKLQSLKSSVKSELTDLGKRCETIFNDHGLSDDMFFQKGKGVPGFIRSISAGEVVKPNSWVLKILEDKPRWSTGKPDPQLMEAIREGLDEALKEAIRFCSDNIKIYNSTEAVLSNMYALGILTDVLKRVHQVASSENTFLLSEAGEVLSQITGGEQTPFIYEKIGNIYENYMIDEFQDTSLLQWRNFDPLIKESMGRGCDDLLVGDIKQSIYRWRNSDWRILAEMKDELVDGKRFLSKPLLTNWRSRSNIIRFNNSLFSVIPAQIDETFREDVSSSEFRKLYAEAIQKDPGKRSGGYVRLEFIDNEAVNGIKEENITGSKQPWKEKVLENLPSVIESVQDKGYKASDIGIIVRESGEGEDVVRRMIEYSVNCPDQKKTRYNYNIVSNDSLVLHASHALSFIISAIKVLDDTDDMISRAEMIRFFLLATGNENADRIPLFRDNLADGSHGCFPESTEEFMKKTRELPLFEATENIIGFFGLGNYEWNVAYLVTFQDLVLNFSGNKGNDFKSFLEWWEATGQTKSVVLPANQDAARVFTIHKSKGLEFRIVIIPFISWNLDHKPGKYPILWVKPEIPPFNELGILPVRYNKKLTETVFAEDYEHERYSVFIDNINLLYVAMTRAIDVLWGFAPDNPTSSQAIADALKNALTSEENPAGESGTIMNRYYDKDSKLYEFGEIPENREAIPENREIVSGSYSVSRKPASLRLKLHGENYFSEERKEKISYGKLMHSVFESIDSSEDIPSAVTNLVLEGIIPQSEAGDLTEKLKTLIAAPSVSGWFRPGIRVLKEAEILLPSGHIRRPDRIIMTGKKTTIIDFKFGEENSRYANQVNQYRKLMEEMGYTGIEAFLWYVDKNRIVAVQ
jgi:ATP-dependent helicase/nuclease subunit A